MSKKDIIDYVMETPGNTNKKVLGRLIDEVEGAKLPEVTEDDNGSVLTVVEGAWDKAEPSGGSDVFMVELEESGVVVTFKKTWKEIHDAFISGATILLHRPDNQWFDEQYSTVSDISHYASDGRYDVAAVFSDQRQLFSTNDENGYPSASFD